MQKNKKIIIKKNLCEFEARWSSFFSLQHKTQTVQPQGDYKGSINEKNTLSVCVFTHILDLQMLIPNIVLLHVCIFFFGRFLLW